MGRMKDALIDAMENDPDMYDGYADYEFWIQCRKEELLERKFTRIYHSKVTKNGS